MEKEEKVLTRVEKIEVKLEELAQLLGSDYPAMIIVPVNEGAFSIVNLGNEEENELLKSVVNVGMSLTHQAINMKNTFIASSAYFSSMDHGFAIKLTSSMMNVAAKKAAEQSINEEDEEVEVNTEIN
jgi:hypothetical protein